MTVANDLFSSIIDYGGSNARVIYCDNAFMCVSFNLNCIIFNLKGNAPAQAGYAIDSS